MRRLALWWWVGLLGWATAGFGQFEVQTRLERDTFLLYESVPVTVAIRNYSGRPLTVAAGNESWLQFLIADEAGSLVRALKALRLDEPLTIGPGQAISQTFDLLPLYELRQRGGYRLQARVTLEGAARLSPPERFSVLQGREIWREVAGQPPGPDGAASYRLYTLQVRRGDRADILYAGVQDQQEQLVYGMLPLGTYLPVGGAQARTDKDGRLHVLYHTQPRSFGYVCIDAQARIVDRAVYSDLLSPPQLLADADRAVEVIGGEKIYPRPERLPAPAEPPAPPKKKKWWWPFGGDKKPAKLASR